MRRYTVVVSFCSSIDIKVLADNKEKASKKAENLILHMDHKSFINRLELQHAGTEIIDKKET